MLLAGHAGWLGIQERGYFGGLGLCCVSLPSLGHTSQLTGLTSFPVRPLGHLSRVRLCNPVDCSPPGSSVHGNLQARTLAWITMLSPVEDQGLNLCLLHLLHCRWILYCCTSWGAPHFLDQRSNLALGSDCTESWATRELPFSKVIFVSIYRYV